MAGSLRDQLLKAGLVNQQQVKKAAHEKRKTKAPPQDDKARAAAAAQQAQAAKAERDRELNRQRQEEAERKAAAAQIKQIIETSRLEKTDGDIPYNFVDGSKVKRLYVTKELQEQLVRGKLAIAKLAGRHELVPLEAAEKIAERDPKRVILTNTGTAEQPAADDPYAAYQVPDDLIW